MVAYMKPSERRSINRLTDPKALRALAHPIRMSLVGMLRVHGPLTATKAAELLGESSASCSFHLRQLAKYGLVEEAGGGQGRERPWRQTSMFTGWPEVTDDPEVAAAAGLLTSVVAENYFDQTMRWIDARSGEPEEWQRAAHFGDSCLYVTAAELAELGDQVRALVDQYLDREADPASRPPGSRPVTYLHLAFPRMDAAGRLAAKDYASARAEAGPGAGETPAGQPGAAHPAAETPNGQPGAAHPAAETPDGQPGREATDGRGPAGP
jgi:DNA-binding transcriptional ArsR family regulator